MLLVERLRVYIHVAYAHPVCAAGQIVLGASLAVSPWAVCLRVDADQWSVSDCISHGGPK